MFVFGRGAIATLYGWAFSEADHTVLTDALLKTVHFGIFGARPTARELAVRDLAGSHVKLMDSGTHRRNAILNTHELLGLLEGGHVDFSLHKAGLAIMKLPAWIGGMALGLAYQRQLSGRRRPRPQHRTTCLKPPVVF